MHKFVISKRYGKLFEVLVIESTVHGENIVFPANEMPLVFRTDASARKIGSKICQHFSSRSSKSNTHTLLIDNNPVVSLPNALLEEIVEVWKSQSISLGKVEITDKEVSQEHCCETLLKAIYDQAIRL